VACLVRQNDFQAGVVISASHNPFQDNGVKLFSHAGMKFPDAVEEELEAGILRHRGEAAPKNLPPLAADESLDAEYLAFLRKRFIPGAKLAGFRIVLDCANGQPSSSARSCSGRSALKLSPWAFHRTAATSTPAAVRCTSRACRKRVVAEKARLRRGL